LAIVAVDVLGLSYREAARALRVREATLTTRLFRARKEVAERFNPNEPKSQSSDGKARAPAESYRVKEHHE
jgi:DNA-directed RNA polymerase specialized sigma24 family protein